MVFFGNLIYSIAISYFFGKKYKDCQLSDGALFLLFFHFCAIWLIISGGQYYVGTDYPTYIGLFDGWGLELYQEKGEFLFYYIIKICNSIGIHGQGLYYIFYTINFTLLFLILKRFQASNLFIFILLYIGYTNIFNNQLNMLRQAVAIHCGTYACILYCESKAKQCLVWIGIAFFMHVSSIILLSIYLYPFVKKLNKKWLEIILIISFIGSFFLNLKTFSFLTDYLPPAYAAHLEKEEMSSSIFTSLTKYIFIPFFYWGLKLLENNSLNNFEKKLFYFGYLGFCFKLLLLKVPIVNRLADYFIIISAFPIFFYLIDLKKQNKEILFGIICLAIIAFYGLKTILFPKAEYIYNSIYFLL